jgi:hypothetical protein
VTDQESADNILKIYYNIMADVGIGKNLKIHLVDVSNAIEECYKKIEIQRQNGDSTDSFATIQEKFIDLKNQIIDEMNDV